MEPFFCSHESRQAGEDPIGMAGDEQLYVLIECPPPWSARALSSQSITGDIDCFKDIYRGWSLLPYLAQVLERELIFRYGWEWFDYSVDCQIIEQNEEETFSRIELMFQTPDGVLKGYRADVVEDESKCLYLIGDCEGTQAEKTPQFHVQNLREIKLLSVGG